MKFFLHLDRPLKNVYFYVGEGMLKTSSLKIFAALFTALWACVSSAEDLPAWAPVQEINRPFADATQTDQIDPYTGSLKLIYRDVEIPGNGGLDIEVTRVYDTGAMQFGSSGSQNSPNAYSFSYKWVGLGLGWSLNVAPKVVLYPYNSQGASSPLQPNENRICGGSAVGPTYILEHVDGRSEPIVRISVGVGRTSSNWEFSCTSTSGPFLLRGPDGTRYELGLVHANAVSAPTTPFDMTYRPITVYLATKVIDRNNNYLNIAYGSFGAGQNLVYGWQTWGAYLPTAITSSDGRSLEFNYDAGVAWGSAGAHPPRLLSIKRNGQTLRSYGFAMGLYYDQLVEVVRPDGTKWTYTYSADNDSYLGATAAAARIKSVTEPSGGSKSYEYSNSGYHVCDWANDPSPMGEDFKFVYFNQVAKVQSSDGGIWSYGYSRANTNGQYDVTTITGPARTETYKHIGVGYFTPAGNNVSLNYGMFCDVDRAPDPWKLGLLVEKTVGGQMTETYGWSTRLLSTAWGQAIRSRTMLQTYPLGSNNFYVPVLTTTTTVINGASYATSYSNYDSFGNAGTKAESGPNGGGRTTTLTYLNDPAKWIIGIPKDESFSGGSLTRSFDSNGNLLSIVRDGVTTSYTYDSQGNVATKTFPRGLIHSYSNYKRGIPQAESQPEGITLTRVVSDAGKVTSETNGGGHITGYSYDALNRLTSIVYPIKNAKSITYTANSKIAIRGGLTETTNYDGFGRPVSVTLGGIATSYVYDSLGRRTFQSNPGDSVGVSYQYDSLDRVTRITNPDSSFQVISYGAATKTVTDENNKATTYSYRSYGDPADQLLMSISAPVAAVNTTIQRNDKGLVTSVSQGGFTRSYGYNSNYYLTSVTNPETGITTYGRDIAGNMTSRVVGASATATYTYDNQNRLQGTSYSDGTPAVNQTYSKTNRILTASSSAANRTYAYDANDNLIRETLNIDGITLQNQYGYNANDQLSMVVYPRSNRVVSYSPDVLGRPTLVSGYVNGVTYWPSGQIKQINYANGTVTNYDQNSRLWPSLFRTQKAGLNYVNSSYSYDGVGNLANISDSSDNSYSRLFGYDGVNRITEIVAPWGSGAVSYSGTGNILSQQLGALNLSYTYNSSNLLTNVSGSRNTAYSYDNYGNIATGSGNTYTYDGAPNLRCVNCSNTSTKIEYGYDGLNQRVSVLKAGVKSYEIYNSQGSQLAEYTPSQDSRLVEYLYLGGKRIAQRVSTQEDYAADQLLDDDHDGLTNIQEFQLGTLINNADSDGDGLSDSYEVSYELNPLSSGDAHQDIDGDGLDNLAEYLAHTNPRKADTDGDGVPDGLDSMPLFNIAAFIPILYLLLN